MSYRQLLTRRSLQHVPVSSLMLSNFATVELDTPINMLVDEYINAQRPARFSGAGKRPASGTRFP
jgi:hypothetical protein